MQNSSDDLAVQQKEAMRQQWAGRAAAFGAMTARGALNEATDLLLAVLRLRSGMQILDVASGPGEPAITLAATVAPEGQVTATDLVPEMLAVAEENARARGVSNITFQQADAEALPFPDATFDAVTCRFGVMLFPNTQRALGEMRRVLKPDGQLVCIVWGPQEQDAMSRPLSVVRKFIELPPLPSSNTPHRFRFSAPGTLAEQLRTAGFRQVEETLHTMPLQWQGTAEEWWNMMLKTNDAMRVASEGLDADRRAELMRAALEARRAEENRAGGPTAAVIVVSAVR